MMMRKAGTYMVSNVATAALGFAGAAIFTRIYTPNDYGLYLVANSVGGILSAALFTWVRLSVLRLSAQSEEADVRLTALGAYGISAALLLPALPLLHLAFGLSWEEATGACLFAATIALFEMQLEILRAKQRAGRYALGSISRAVMMVLAGVVLNLAGFGGFGLSVSIALAYLLGSAVLASDVWQRPVAPFGRKIVVQMLAFGIPVTISGLTLAIHTATDRLAVNALLGQAMGGQYGVAADFTRQLILVPATALGSAFIPAAVRAFATAGPDVARRHLRDGGELMMALLLPAVVGLALTGHTLASIVLGPSFRDEAGRLIPILSFVWLLQALTQNYVHVSFHLTGKTRGMVLQAIIALAANLILIVPMTKLFGILGAASGVLAAEAIGLVAGAHLARASFPLPIDWTALARIGGATGAMAGAVVLVASRLPLQGPVLLGCQICTGVVVYVAVAAGLDVGGVRKHLPRWRRFKPAA